MELSQAISILRLNTVVLDRGELATVAWIESLYRPTMDAVGSCVMDNGTALRH